MATLDTATNLTPNLSVKFHSARGMKQEERDTIKKCLKKANEAVAMTVDVIAGTKSSSIKGAALFAHFRVSSATAPTLATVTTNFNAIRVGLNGPLNISDVYQRNGVGTLGYVDTITPLAGPARKRSIHLEFNLLKDALRPVASMTIIHEASHKFANTADNAYAYQASYNQLSALQAANNADSYAYFAWSIYLGKVVTSTDALSQAFRRLHLGIL
jgi:hypothetical protein